MDLRWKDAANNDITRIRKAGTPEMSQKRPYDDWAINWRSLPTVKTRHQSGGGASEGVDSGRGTSRDSSIL